MQTGTPRSGPFVAGLALGAAAVVIVTGALGGDAVLGPDGLLHLAVTHQVANGLVPPTNPLQMGTPLDGGWTWHLVVATLAERADLAPGLAALLLSAVASGALLVLIWSLTGLYTRRPWVRLAFTLAPFLVLNPVAPLRLLYLLADGDGGAISADAIALQPFGRLGAAGNLLAALVGVGPFAVLAALVVASGLVLLRQRWATRARTAAGVLLGLLAALLHPDGALAVSLVAGGALVALGAEQWLHRPRRWATSLSNGAPAMALLVASIVTAAISGAEPPAVAGPAAALDNGWRYGWMLAPMAPFWVVGTARFARITRPTRLLVAMGTALGLGMLLLELPGARQHELGLLTAPISTLLLLGLLDELMPGWRGTTGPGARQRVTIVWTVGAGALACVAASTIALASAGRASELRWSGPHTDLVAEPSDRVDYHRRAAYHWLREHTPRRAYVLEDPPEVGRLDLSVVAQRRTVVGRGTVYAPHHEVLVERVDAFVKRLGACEAAPTDLARLLSTPVPWPRSVYALAVVPETGPCPTLPDGMAAVYDNTHWAVYVIQVPRR